MSTFYDFRAEIATQMDLYYSGVITGEDAGFTYIEDSNLLRFANSNVLVGGHLFTAKDAGLGGWRDVQWRPIVSFSPYVSEPEAQPRIGVEYPLTLDDDETTLVGDMYEVFRALTPDQWDKAILDAVKSAWPMIFEIRRIAPTSTLGGGYAFPTDEFDEIREVRVRDPINWPDYGEQPILPSLWRVEKSQTDKSPTLHFMHPLSDDIQLSDILCYVSGRYVIDDITATDSYPRMDHAYLTYQSKANAYGILADETQRQAVHGNYMTQAQYSQELADRRKVEVYNHLTGAEVKAE